MYVCMYVCVGGGKQGGEGIVKRVYQGKRGTRTKVSFLPFPSLQMVACFSSSSTSSCTSKEQLRRIEGGLNKVNQDLKRAEHEISGMEKFCGLCGCGCFKPNIERSKSYKSAWKDDGVSGRGDDEIRFAKERGRWQALFFFLFFPFFFFFFPPSFFFFFTLFSFFLSLLFFLFFILTLLGLMGRFSIFLSVVFFFPLFLSSEVRESGVLEFFFRFCRFLFFFFWLPFFFSPPLISLHIYFFSRLWTRSPRSKMMKMMWIADHEGRGRRNSSSASQATLAKMK